MVKSIPDMRNGTDPEMKLFDYFVDYDFGLDIYATIGQFENFNLLDATIHTCEYWNWEPNIQLSMGVFSGSVLSFGIEILSFSFSMSFIPYRFPMNLSHTREL
jgi:hypothetical protein